LATIIIEDGSNVPGANSYLTVAELDTYAADRGVIIAASDKTILLIEAMDYLESLLYIGLKHNTDQTLQWPRVNVVIDGFLIGTNIIPELLKDGQAEVALAIDNSESPLQDIERVQQSVSVGKGAVAVTYANNSQATTIVRKINAKLHKLLATSLTGISFAVSKA